MGQVKTRGKLFGTYALLYGALACSIVVAWDADDWRHLDVVAVLVAATLLLDVLAARALIKHGQTQCYGSFTCIVLAAVLLGPVPAAVIGLITSSIDSVRCRARLPYLLGNTFAFSAVPLVAGLASDRWLHPLHGLALAAAVALLTVAFDVSTTVVVFVQAGANGDLDLQRAVESYVRIAPWLGAVSIVVAGAADGYRAGGLGVLVLFILGLVACQVLLIRLDAVDLRLRAERDRSAAYLRAVGTMVVSLDTDGRVAFVNERARDLLGDVVGTDWNDVDAGGRVLAWTSTPLPDGALLLSGEDVTARHEQEERMARLAFVDVLTDVGNRAVLDRELPGALARADDTETTAALLLVDLDGFKRVNDAHGHAVGDAVLAEAAARLRAVAAPGELLIRRGGDEFLLLKPSLGAVAGDECAARRAAAAVAERLVRAFEAPFAVAGRVDVSVATALHPFDGPDLEQAANRALHGIKQRSLDRVFQ